MFFNLFTLYSVHVSALVIVLSDSPRERISKSETCLILKKDKLVDVSSAGASVTENCHIITCIKSESF
jgi:hypothetical protein